MTEIDKPESQQTAAGIVLTVVGVVAAIAAGIFVDHSVSALIAFIFLYFMVDDVKEATDYKLHPVARGGVMMIFSLLIAAAELFLQSSDPLFALIFVAMFTEDIV